MINNYLPDFHFREHHNKMVNAPLQVVYPQVRHLNFNSSRIIRFLFILRGINLKDFSFDYMIDRGSFFTLDEKINQEWVIGLVTKRFLLPTRLKPKEDFKEWKPKQGVKIVWNFKLQEIENQKVDVKTETRVLCMSKKTLFWFSIYWMIIRPFSGLIRREMLRIIKQKSEERYSKVKTIYN